MKLKGSFLKVVSGFFALSHLSTAASTLKTCYMTFYNFHYQSWSSSIKSNYCSYITHAFEFNGNSIFFKQASSIFHKTSPKIKSDITCLKFLYSINMLISSWDHIPPCKWSLGNPTFFVSLIRHINSPKPTLSH